MTAQSVLKPYVKPERLASTLSPEARGFLNTFKSALFDAEQHLESADLESEVWVDDMPQMPDEIKRIKAAYELLHAAIADACATK